MGPSILSPHVILLWLVQSVVSIFLPLSYFSSLCCLSPFWYKEEAFSASSTYHIIACCRVIRTYVVLGAVKLEPRVGHDLASMLQCTCEK
jgi:hypothetical protein